MLDSRTSWKFQRLLAIAAVLGLLFQHDLIAVLWIEAVFPYLMVLAFACLLALDALLAKLRRLPAPHVWSALLLAIAVGPAIPLLLIPFSWISAAHKLVRNQSHYAELVKRAEAGERVPEIYMTDAGPPRLSYFVWGGWGSDSWGIVHDRSRTFSKAPVDVLGGDLLTQMHLWGPWFYAEFR